ncbi:MAG: hypothetical protein ACLQUY_23775 [Ktedonobacterales bacterium]
MSNEEHGPAGRDSLRQPEPLEPRIDRLPEIIASLPDYERTLANQLFRIDLAEGTIVPPLEMVPWLQKTFGGEESALHQRIVRITNRWTFEGATFNPLRSRRPSSGATTSAAVFPPPEVRTRIVETSGDDFCDPLHRTPADTFGRVQGRHTTTAANVAKADGWHGIGIFDRHDPLKIENELVSDMLSTAGEWASRAHSSDPQARFLFLFWNCLWRAGASLVHGHIQMTLSRQMAHAKVENLRASAERYQTETGSDYFADLATVHRALGLAAGEEKIDWFASLTPVKEREIVLLAPTYQNGVLQPEELGVLSDQLFRTLALMQEQMGVLAFNVGIFGPPLAAGRPTTKDEKQEDWSSFPLVARIVDRGNPLSSTSDIAGLELFGSSVIASDPFDVARTLQAAHDAGLESASP